MSLKTFLAFVCDAIGEKKFADFSFERLRFYSLLDKKRYVPGRINLAGQQIRYIDAASCFSAWKAIFDDCIYGFDTSSQSPVILDIGANIGIASLYFSMRFPNSRIIALEPDPELFKYLESNCNSIKNVELRNLAVASVAGTSSFSSRKDDSGKLGIRTVDSETSSTTVTCVLLSKVIEDVGREVDLLKIDIEGSEYDVIHESRNWLSSVKRIFVECHSFQGQPQKFDKLLGTLSECGFRYHIESEYTTKMPLNGFKEYEGMDSRINVFAIRM